MGEAKDQGGRPREQATGVFGLPLKRLRTILRIFHLTFGINVAAFEWVVRIALFPLSVVTGIAMWQQAKLRKVLAKGGSR